MPGDEHAAVCPDILTQLTKLYLCVIKKENNLYEICTNMCVQDICRLVSLLYNDIRENVLEINVVQPYNNVFI